MGVTLSVNYTLNSQNVANNTSNVTVNAVVHWTGGSWNSLTQCKGSITIDGTKYSFTGMKFNASHTNSGSQTVMTKKVDIAHNADGTKSLAIAAEFDTYISAGVIRASTTATLKTIPRKSSMTVGNGTLGATQTMSITRASSSFTHTITAKCGTSTQTVVTKTANTSVVFTPPWSWASQNTTGTTLSVTYTLTTYSGDTNIGSATYTKTCAIPASVKPSCSISVSDPTGYATTYGGYIKGLSKLQVTVTPTLSHSSPIKSYKASANGCGYYDATFTTDVIKSHGTLTVAATVTDQRGRTSDTASKSITVLNYTKPSISTLTAERCDSNGTKNDRGEYIRVRFAFSVDVLGGKNNITFALKYKETTASTYTQPAFNYGDGQYMFAADVDTSYDIVVTVADNFNSATRAITGSTGFTLMHWNAEGNAMGIGKVVTKQKLLDVGIDTHFDKKVILENNQSVFGTDTSGTEYSALIPVTSSGNTSLGYGLYEKEQGSTHIYGNKVNFYTKQGIFTNNNDIIMNADTNICGLSTDGQTVKRVFSAVSENGNTIIGYDNYATNSGNTHIYGKDIVFYVSNLPTPTYYRPYRRIGDSISTTIRTAGYVTESKKKVEFYLSLAEPIVGSPSVTISSTSGGLILRQDDKYTHGSNWANSAYTYAVPTKVTCSVNMFCGLTIVAEFSNTTNAINNSTIGINWPCTITFSL